MTVHQINPLSDPRWPNLLSRHPRASIFHTPEWLRALQQTYGYEPVALTTAAPHERLTNGLVFCRVNSWLTGRRVVSVPFSDHCDPLTDDTGSMSNLVGGLEHYSRDRGVRYAEIRPGAGPGVNFRAQKSAGRFCLHELNIRPTLEQLFCAFHKTCIQNKIRRAEREDLSYKCGSTESLLRDFYILTILTRRSQGLPPQPLRWFRNLMICLGDKLTIHLAFKDGAPVAGALTIFHGDTMVYKYGCSDAAFNALGGVPLVIWKSIQEAKSRGLTTYSFGRSDWTNSGLVRFKDRWGAERSMLEYLRFYCLTQSRCTETAQHASWIRKAAKQLVHHLPDRLLCTTGSLLYRHIA